MHNHTRNVCHEMYSFASLSFIVARLIVNDYVQCSYSSPFNLLMDERCFASTTIQLAVKKRTELGEMSTMKMMK